LLSLHFYAHAPINDLLGVAYDTLLTTNLAGIPLFVPLLQVRFRIGDDGVLTKLKEQPPPNLGGEWYGDPAPLASMGTQLAYQKLATDVVLLGHAYPSTPDATEGQVGIRVGAAQKLARVFASVAYSSDLARSA